MLIKKPADIPSSEITDKKVYLDRRQFLQAATGTAAVAAAGVLGAEELLYAATPAPHGRKLDGVKKSPLSTDEKPNKWEEITTYNNYYEFGTDKDSPSLTAHSLKPTPWTVTVDGECAKKGPMNFEDVIKGETLEDRIYRHRCVEALVDGDSVGRVPAREFHQALRADLEGEVRRVHHALRSEADAGRAQSGAATGPTSKGCGWTKPCTR